MTVSPIDLSTTLGPYLVGSHHVAAIGTWFIARSPNKIPRNRCLTQDAATYVYWMPIRAWKSAMNETRHDTGNLKITNCRNYSPRLVEQQHYQHDREQQQGRDQEDGKVPAEARDVLAPGGIVDDVLLAVFGFELATWWGKNWEFWFRNWKQICLFFGGLWVDGNVVRILKSCRTKFHAIFFVFYLVFLIDN